MGILTEDLNLTVGNIYTINIAWSKSRLHALYDYQVEITLIKRMKELDVVKWSAEAITAIIREVIEQMCHVTIPSISLTATMSPHPFIPECEQWDIFLNRNHQCAIFATIKTKDPVDGSFGEAIEFNWH